MGMEEMLGLGKLGFTGGSGAAGISNLKGQHEQIRQSEKLALLFKDRENRQKIGSQIAAVGGSGLEMTGSPLSLINQTRRNLELDRAILKESFEREKETSRANIKKQKISLFTELGKQGMSLAGGAMNYAVPGKGGYALNTPSGTRDMGSYSKLPSKFGK